MIEEDFEDNSNSKTVGLVIEEAKNYDSVNESKLSEQKKSILKNKSGSRNNDLSDAKPATFRSGSKIEEIPVELEDEEYQDDDFDASSGSEILAKVSVS